MNIALIIDDMVSYPPTNGVTYRFVEASKRLSKYPGIHTIIADRGKSDIQKMQEDGFHTTIIPSDWLYNDKYPEVLSALKEKNIDIVHVSNAHSMVPVFGFKLANDLGAKLVCDMHDLYSDLAADPETAQRELHSQLTIANHCDHIFVMSKLDMERLIDYGLDENRLTWAPNGVEVKPERQTPCSTQELVFVGNMYYPPNAEAVMLIKNEIAPAVMKTCPQASFKIIGNAPEHLKADAPSNVNFLGMQPDLGVHFSTALAALAPLMHGGGMKVKMLDYASHSLPIVCTDIAMMGYDKNPGFALCGNINEFIAATIQLLNDPKQAFVCGQQSRSYVDEIFSWNNIIERQYQAYKEINQKPKREQKIEYSKDRAGNITIDGFVIEHPSHLAEERYQEAKPYQTTQIFEIK